MTTTPSRDRIALLGIAAVLTPALLLAGLFGFASQIDEQSRQREQTIVAHGFAARIAGVAHTAVGQSIWDESARHLQTVDQDWAKFNVGDFFIQSSGYEFAGVVDSKSKLAFAVDADDTDGRDLKAFSAAVTPLVAKLRARERQLAPLAQRVPEQVLESPVQETDLIRLGDRYVSITATLVQPDSDASILKQAAPVIIVGEEIDSSFLGALSQQFLLSDLSVADASHVARGPARATFSNAAGKTVFQLAWQPQRPGADLLASAAPLVLVFALILCGMSWFFHHRANRAVEQLIASERRASHQAHHDQLTGLPNRTLTIERLGHALERTRRTGRPFAVHCIDLDRFKDINDTFGHPVGDELICRVAQLLASTCRQTDTVARLGGDEFAVIQDDCTPQKAADLADRIVRLLSAPVDLSVGRIYYGCSIGVSLIASADKHDPQECLRESDLALYRAKETGRGRYSFFEPEMDAALQGRRALQNDLREALKTDQLFMVYQPQVDAQDKVIGLESLMRWTHPTRGNVSPATFIPLAEECGLIEELGWFAMRSAFVDGQKWPGLKIAINVSASQLRLKGFCDQVAALVAETGVDPHRFELEITEGLLLADSAETHDVLARIRAMGFSIALDDFGTGYSSLSYLKRYPITRVKIDRSFVSTLGVDERSDDLVAAIVRLARALKMAVVAEGVETDDQRARLAAAGCRDIQGYLASKPLAVSDVQAFIDGATHRDQAA